MKDIAVIIGKISVKYVAILFGWWLLQEWCYGYLRDGLPERMIGNIVLFLLFKLEWERMK